MDWHKMEGIAWPALLNHRQALVQSLLFQMERSQWFPPQEIEKLQMTQLSHLLSHALHSVPYYRDLNAKINPQPGKPVSLEAFRELPLLTRGDLQQARESLRSTTLGERHGPVNKVQTSGSTGSPVTAYGTMVTKLFWNAIGQREQLWHARENHGVKAVIRRVENLPPGQEGMIKGGRHAGQVHAPLYLMDIHTDIATQAAWLRKRNPNILMSYPSNIRELARIFRQHRWQLPNLKLVRTLGEMIDDEFRSTCRELWGVPVHDMYSTQETGYLAIQCPVHEHYHVQSEIVILEILDAAGNPCKPGEIGRVVITPLHNFALPLIRYDVGDYAEVGEKCSCGRSLPVLKRIMGRQRNILTTPDGRKYWPSFPASVWSGVAPVQQVRIVQETTGQLSVDYVSKQELSPENQNAFCEAIQAKLPCRFEILLNRVDVIPRSVGGKYEDFISRLS